MKNKILSTIVLLIPVLLIAQKKKESVTGKGAVVTITIDSSLLRPSSFWIDPPKDLEFFFSDLNGLERHIVYLQAGETKVRIEGPCFLYGNGIGSRMVYPGDHLAIKFNENQSSVIFSAPGDINRSMDLNITAIFEDSCYLFNRNTYSIIRDHEVNSVEDLLHLETQLLSGNTAMCKRRRIIADSLLRSYNTGTDVRDYMNNKIANDSLHMIISLLEENQGAYIKYDLIRKRFRDLGAALDVLWQSRSGRYDKIVVSRLFDLVLHSNKTGTVIRTTELYYEQKKAIDSFFTGYPRAFLWSDALYTCAKTHITLPVDEIDLYKQDSYNAEYRSMVEARLAMNEKFNKLVVKPGISRVTALSSNKPTTIEAILRKHKGTPVLIDFWASWCGPCIKELPSSIALDKDLDGKVKFIYISFDASFSSWARTSNVQQITPENSYLFIDAHKSDFFNRFKIETIPRYLLYGKDGTLISDNAPRPSERELKTLIEQHL